MEHRKEPGEAHAALMRELHEVVDRFDTNGMPGIERIAILGQLIGQEIARLPKNTPYGPQELLASVAANIEAGNRVGMGKASSNGSGLVGFN